MQPLWKALTIAAGMSLLAACASEGPDESTIASALSRAGTAISVADTGHTRRHAAVELTVAREKFAAARQAARAGEYLLADRLISESLVNVQLAVAKADKGRVMDELRRLDPTAVDELEKGSRVDEDRSAGIGAASALARAGPGGSRFGGRSPQ